MATFVYPDAAELRMIEQDKLPRLIANRPIFDLFPMRSVDAHVLAWEQMDNYLGLQQVRGLDGDPPRIKAVGAKRYIMEPGVYGEFARVDELELTSRRQFGSWNAPVSVADLVAVKQDQLLLRRLDRIELIGWTLLATGTFSVAGPSNAVIHTDSYTTQTFTAGVTWATAATATPLADFRAVQLLSRGHSVDFGTSATAYMNRTTFNQLIANTNANDLAGRYTVLRDTVRSVGTVNQILGGEGLPNVQVYDEGYLAEPSGTFTLFIPNNKVILVGQRQGGQAIGEYRFTRNANNPNLAPGPYTRVIDRGENEVPRMLDVHDGHNGGPVIYFPSAVVVMTV